MNEDVKGAIDKRMRRIAGQVSGIQKMIDDDRYCIDVLTQISATRAALAKVSSLLLESHLNGCVRTAFASDDDDERNAKLQELLVLFEKNCNR